MQIKEPLLPQHTEPPELGVLSDEIRLDVQKYLATRGPEAAELFQKPRQSFNELMVEMREKTRYLRTLREKFSRLASDDPVKPGLEEKIKQAQSAYEDTEAKISKLTQKMTENRKEYSSQFNDNQTSDGVVHTTIKIRVC